jgi:molybdopterin converting factor small subunit
MTTKVELYGQLRWLAGAREVEVAAETVAEAIAELCRKAPALGRLLVSPDGLPSRHVIVVVDDEVVSQASVLLPGARMSLLPAVAGGATASPGAGSPARVIPGLRALGRFGGALIPGGGGPPRRRARRPRRGGCGEEAAPF